MKHHRTVLDCACPEQCYREAKFHPQKDKEIQEAQRIYDEVNARLIACNRDNAELAYEAYCKKALEAPIEDALAGHKTKAQFLAEYSDMEMKEMDHHLRVCREK